MLLNSSDNSGFACGQCNTFNQFLHWVRQYWSDPLYLCCHHCAAVHQVHEGCVSLREHQD